MATFRALNIESDDDTDDEVDNTKEIQIEEALKIYQTALKFHAQGPDSLREAGEAYKSLFESEIFKYAESQSEYNRVEAYEDALRLGISLPLVVETTSAQQTTGGTENGPNVLPQILHLSYKNRGEYHLDNLNQSLKVHGGTHLDDAHDTGKQVRRAVKGALDDFSEALDKDEDDANLWRRAAKVSSTLNSKRSARYCLEAALEGDAEGTDDILGFPNIEANVTKQELLSLETVIQDDLALLQPTTPESHAAPASLFLKNQLKLYPFLPSSISEIANEDAVKADAEPKRPTSVLQDFTWKALGNAILACYINSKDTAVTDTNFESICRLTLPPQEDIPRLTDTLIKPSEREDSAAQTERSIDGGASNTTPPRQSSQKDAVLEESVVNQTSLKSIGQDKGNPEGNAGATLTLPTRKRSLEATESVEGAEGPRGRSKRIRARPSILGEGDLAAPTGLDPQNHVDKDLEECIQTDIWLFETLDQLAKRLDIDVFSEASKLRFLVNPDSSVSQDVAVSDVPLRSAIKGFYSAMQTWNDEKTRLLTHDTTTVENTDYARNAGLISYSIQADIQVSNDDNDELYGSVTEFVNQINSEGWTTGEVALNYVMATLAPPGLLALNTSPLREAQIYSTTRLCKESYATLEKLVVLFDEVFQRALSKVLQEQIQVQHSSFPEPPGPWTAASVMQTIQCLFEIHTDLFVRRGQPGDEIVAEPLSAYKNRMDEWSYLAREAINILSETVDEARQITMTPLQLRHTWASVMQLRYSNEAPRDHIVTCLGELKVAFSRAGHPVIELPNNNTMPIMSNEAAAREVSKLETIAFFQNIFQKDDDDPYELIERLEPIMERSLARSAEPEVDAALTAPEHGASSYGENNKNSPRDSPASIRAFLVFLAKSKVALRLSLWQRLQEAWETVEHPPKVFATCLRSIEILVTDLKALGRNDLPLENHGNVIIYSLQQFNRLLVKLLQVTENSTDPFECMDFESFQSATRAVAELTTFLHTISLYDDYSQAGQKGPLLANPFRSYPSESFHQAAIILHDMQIRAYILLYKLLCEAMVRHTEDFPNPTENRVAYLRHVHYTFGVRRLCKASDGLYLKFMMDELMSLTAVDKANSDDCAQVLYDLYDLWYFSDAWGKFDHGCQSDYLDRKTALTLLDMTLEKVKQVSVKDLLKSELGRTVERINTALGVTKGGLATARNKKIYNAYMRSPINPLALIRCVDGVGQVSTVNVSPEESIVASKRWYFLRGQMSLTKYKSQVRKGPSPTDDLQSAISLFSQDLECNTEGWEPWYRIAQAYDAIFEEQVIWSAEKINTQRAELNQLQRSAIHAYTMATAAAVRNAEVSQASILRMSEMYADFGMRVYASSRQPFSMEVFSLESYAEKPAFGANSHDTTLNMRMPFRPLSLLEAFKFASVLFRKSLIGRPNHWPTHFMLGNCLWKMYTGGNRSGSLSSKAVNKILASFLKAVEHTPPRKDPNRQDPILEPINKLVSIVHKLRMDHDDEIATGAIEKMFQKQKQFDVPSVPDFNTHDSWWTYILEVFKILRAADKAKWHHRPIMTTAHIIFDMDRSNRRKAAMEAKDFLAERGIYSTKTLSLTVWKPDRERPGRHYIYLTRYSEFLVELFEETDDWESLSMMAKRIRKKADMYFEHAKLWEEVVGALIKVLRRCCDVPEHYEDNVFRSMSQEDFNPKATLIEEWVSSVNTRHQLNDVLREATELKKLNGGLAKSPVIDDLIADVFAKVWVTIGPSLEPSRLPASVPVQSPSTYAPPFAQPLTPRSPQPPVTRRDDKMSLMHLINIDGANDIRSPPAIKTVAAPKPLSLATPGEAFLAQELSAATVRPRIRLVSRREVLKRATDAASARPAANSTPIRPTPHSRDSNVRVVIPARRPSGAVPLLDTPGQSMEDKPMHASPSLSSLGSVHDSADDEGELSEMGEDPNAEGHEGDGDLDDDVDMEDADAEGESDVEADADVDADEEEGEEDIDLQNKPRIMSANHAALGDALKPLTSRTGAGEVTQVGRVV